MHCLQGSSCGSLAQRIAPLLQQLSRQLQPPQVLQTPALKARTEQVIWVLQQCATLLMRSPLHMQVPRSCSRPQADRTVAGNQGCRPHQCCTSSLRRLSRVDTSLR